MTRRCCGSRPVPHLHRRPAAAPSAPAPSARGRRVPPRARCGAAPRFWGRHRLHGERPRLAPAPGLRPPGPLRHREVGGPAGRQVPALNLPKFGRSSMPGACRSGGTRTRSSSLGPGGTGRPTAPARHGRSTPPLPHGWFPFPTDGLFPFPTGAPRATAWANTPCPQRGPGPHVQGDAATSPACQERGEKGCLPREIKDS